MKFNNAKVYVLHMDWGNPKHKYRLDDQWIESSSAEKDLRALVDEKLNTSQQYTLAARKPIASWATSRDVWPAGHGIWFFPLKPLEYCVQLWGLQHKT